MPAPTTTAYLFVAAKPDGGRTLGMRRAKDQRDLSQQLRRQRLVPLQTWALPEWAGAGEGKVRLKDQNELHTQLAQLLTRGVPLVEALDVCTTSVAPRTRPLVQRMRELVASGTSFAEAARSVEMFDAVTIAVYRAAERTGDLGGAAKQLATTTRRQLAIQGKVGTLLVYPCVVLSISLAFGLFMVMFVVPRIGEAMAGANIELPWFTRALVGTGQFLRENGMWVLLGVVVLAAGGVLARRPIGALVARAARAMPIVRDVVIAQESARFFTVMAAMTHSGITLGDSLGVASGVLGHPVLRDQLGTLRAKLIEGGVLRSLIDNVTALPIPTRRLMMAAERSGDLQSAFETLAMDHTEELDRRTARLLAALEPALIVLMFAIIGSLVLAIMVPMLKATAQIGA
jgi:type II secretory pathway component PulF